MNATNPYEYNADLIPEQNWFFQSTIVLKQPASEVGFRKIKNKEVLKWLHRTLKSILGDEILVPYTQWFAICYSEIQKIVNYYTFILSLEIYLVNDIPKPIHILYLKEK